MKVLLATLTLLFCSPTFCQTQVYTQDVKNFYAAFDSVHKQTDRSQQLATIESLYIKPGSDGLKEFMSLGAANSKRWLNYMLYSKNYLLSVRPLLESVSEQAEDIQEKLLKLKQQYPSFRDGKIYVVVGCGLVGGSPDLKTATLILGAEVLVKQKKDWVVPAAIHEFIHLQQKEGNRNLLTQTITEGVAEFLSELFFGKSLAAEGAQHLSFGMANEKAVWDNYLKELFIINNGYMGWLYGSKKIAGKEVRDLGYFVGYQICKSFYQRSKDKSAAIKTMLELDLSANEAAREFVLQSAYAKGKDVAKIQSGKFTTHSIVPKVDKTLYGYYMTADSIIFNYTIPAEFLSFYKGNVGLVCVAGSFNDWNAGSPQYRMLPAGKNSFRLGISKSKLNLTETPQFKFVINEDVWMPVPETAKNVDAQSGNLTLLKSGNN